MYITVYILYMYIYLEDYTAIVANYQQLFWGNNPVVGGNGTKRQTFISLYACAFELSLHAYINYSKIV